MKIYLFIFAAAMYLLSSFSPAAANCSATLTGSSTTSLEVTWDANTCKRIDSDKIKICWKPAGHIQDTCNYANTETYGKNSLYTITGLSADKEYKVKLHYEKKGLFGKKWKRFFKAKTTTASLDIVGFRISNVGPNSITLNWNPTTTTSGEGRVNIKIKREHELKYGRAYSGSNFLGTFTQTWDPLMTSVTIEGYCPPKILDIVKDCEPLGLYTKYKLRAYIARDGGTIRWHPSSVMKVVLPHAEVNGDFDVCFYEQPHHQGNQWCYKVGDIPFVGTGANDKFASIDILDPDIAVTVFQDANYLGTQTVWANSQADLGSMNYTISSLKIIEWPDVDYHIAAGVGYAAQGAGVAIQDLDGNNTPDLIMMGYDNPSGANEFRYIVGKDVQPTGAVSSWSSPISVAGVGWEGQGAGITFTDLDNNQIPEMVLMAIDNPSGANKFRYRIRWNVDALGIPTIGGETSHVGLGLGWEANGGGIAFGNFDNDLRPDMVLMAYDAPSTANRYDYHIGWNIDSNGNPTTWTTHSTSGQGWLAEGAGIAVADIGGGPEQEIVLMSYDAPSGVNNFRYKIGWDIQSNGEPNNNDWVDGDELHGVGHVGHGADIAIGNIDADLEPETIFMALDPYVNGNQFRYFVHD